MRFLYALRFLTIIPIPYKQDEDLAKMARSTIFFPLTGLFIGGLLYGTAYLLSLIFPPMLTSSLVLLIWIVITGGLHLDGLADLADGLGGGRTREDKLRIMKDSRIGAFGVIALIILLLIKWNLVLQLINDDGLLLFLMVPMGSRWITMNLILLFPAARKDGMGSFFKKYARLREPIGAGIFTLAAAFLIAGFPGIIICTGGLILLCPVTAVISRILGGLTGDVYGTMIEAGELTLMLLIPILWMVL